MNGANSGGNEAGRQRLLRAVVPGLHTAAHYDRSWIWPDIRAGVVLSTLLIPAGMGYAVASGLPAYTGLFATIVPLIAYAIFGPSRILVLGPDSALAPIIAAAIIPLAAGDEARAVALAGLLGIMVGVLLFVGGLARLGFLTSLLSKPIQVGYLNAIALIVIVSQVPALLGFSSSGSAPTERILGLVDAIGGGAIQPIPSLIGLGAIAVMLLFKYVIRQPGIGLLVAVVLASIAAFVLQRGDELPVVGAMPGGLPAPALGGLTWGDVLMLIGPAFGLALIAFTDTAVLSRTLASRRGESVDGSREMIGLGIANVAGGAFGGFPVSASTSRTPVGEQAGAQTQLTGVVGALVVLLFMLVVPGVTAYLPDAALAAVVIVAASSLINIPAYVRLWKMDPPEAVLSTFAFFGVFLVGVLEGILVAIALSFVAMAWRVSRPYRAELGYVPGLRGYHDISRYEDAERIDGVVIVRFDAPLFFANASLFAEFMRATVREARAEAEAEGLQPIETVILASEPITDIDSTAMDELLNLDSYFVSRGITLIFAEMKSPVWDHFASYELNKHFPSERFAPTVGAAVDEVTGQLRTDIVGTDGDTGTDGDAGIDADAGTDGDAGIDADAGSDGDAGIDGDVGINGDAGSDGDAGDAAGSAAGDAKRVDGDADAAEGAPPASGT
ncbi:MAG: SulP family inorganic anion transporter [Gulosibacter sp.]|uniref:SulP family inorganic anion transporter n=1 Tax=Gulosibacter sp. TaxID=2817531 RepID=UPI003F92645C